MRFSFNTLRHEVRFHCPEPLRPLLRKEKDQQRAARAAEQSETAQEPPLLHTQANNRRYHFFRMVSLTPRAATNGTIETTDSSDTRRSSIQEEILIEEEEITETTEETVEVQEPISVEESMPFARKSDDAPIRNLEWAQAIEALDTFKEKLIAWAPDFDREAFKSSGTLDKDASTLTPEEKTDIRLYHTHNVLDQIIKDMNPSNQTLFSPSAIFVNEVPVGIMLLCDTDPTYMACMVTHPGQQTAGGSLIEHAVDSSIAWRRNGVIQLLLDNPAAKERYRGIGFTCEEGSDEMTLDPSQQRDKWHQVGDRWRLKDYVDQKYLVSFGRSPTAEQGS